MESYQWEIGTFPLVMNFILAKKISKTIEWDIQFVFNLEKKRYCCSYYITSGFFDSSLEANDYPHVSMENQSTGVVFLQPLSTSQKENKCNGDL